MAPEQHVTLLEAWAVYIVRSYYKTMPSHDNIVELLGALMKILPRGVRIFSDGFDVFMEVDTKLCEVFDPQWAYGIKEVRIDGKLWNR